MNHKYIDVAKHNPRVLTVAGSLLLIDLLLLMLI